MPTGFAKIAAILGAILFVPVLFIALMHGIFDTNPLAGTVIVAALVGGAYLFIKKRFRRA